MMGYYGYNMGSLFGFGWILTIVFWAIVIWVIFALINSSAHRDHKQTDNNNRALEILKERYAKSEISKEEYEEKKKILLD